MKINFVIGNGKYDNQWSLEYLMDIRVFQFMNPKFRSELETAIFGAMNKFVQNNLWFEPATKEANSETPITSCDLNDLQLITFTSVNDFLDYEVRETGLTKSLIRDLLTCNSMISKQYIAEFFLKKVYPNINVVIKPTEK